ncbi:hypothetical protein E5K00_07475 [Hymenobacter aquaticus]|uniref:SH3 domain-containing protein n=1 Tax=Hymenobacter aquaticus TaxID=1867101 RepID=A0A4Z0Q4Q1_9BACT|nr:hypothetical protein [Hymenobacter aquaticus]TGE25030.1 hypothetical protein E5K00_07475 [Hymenobacter aquaticus]
MPASHCRPPRSGDLLPLLFDARPASSVWRMLAHGLLLGLAAPGLLACSDDAARRPDSELRVDAPAPDQRRPSVIEAENAAAAALPAGAGRRYRVRAETAYFYDSPRQARPRGNYLRRGDVLYGQDEGNGFVKTRFVSPQGATVAGWLKMQDLSSLIENASAQASRSRPTAPAAPAARPAATQPLEPAQTSPGGAQTAVVRVARAYFYNSPDLGQPRKAYCEQGDKVRLGQEQGAAVYVTFTNWEKVTTRGWMHKQDLGLRE